MNSYVTSYAKGQQTGTDRRTQERINASIKSMREMIDEFQPEKEVQHYGEIKYTGKIFDGVSLSSKPTDSVIPVIGKCNNYAILVGYVDYGGTLVINCSPTFTDDVTGIIVTERTEEHFERQGYPPVDETVEIGTTEVKEEYDVDGALIKREGKETKYRQRTHKNVVSYFIGQGEEERLVYDYDRTTTYYIIPDYTEVKDFTNAVFNIDVKYRGKER